MKYEFILMYMGEEIGKQSFDNYEAARKFCYYEYYTLDRGCRVFVDGKEITIFEAYDYFNLVEYSIDYIWRKDISGKEFS